ncbi:MAG TPA: SurA N-terminal domain-containing protein [Burkholderiales bacterium]|nr:SurA N-terminal domain-containing protein [Burkholderiales bacterium]
MFDFVQKNRRILQVFLGLIAITFATWGIESYTRYGGGRDTVASVNGSDISQREFAEQVRAQQEQLRRMFGGRIDPAALETPEARRAVLDQMIAQRLVAVEAAKRNLFMSREAVIEAITQAPEFQENGKFSPALYSAYLSQRGITDQRNVVELQSQLPLMRFVGAIGETAIVSRAVASRLMQLESQQREVSEARIRAQQFLPQVKLDEAQIKQHYDANPAEFRTPERVRVEYVMLSAESLARQDPPTEEEVKKAYEARAAAFRVEEQRRASHVLVKTKEEADKILAEVKRAPNRFAELAKQHSQDPGSAEKGGDLGWFGRGMMVKPFEDAVFSMKQGEVQVAQSEFGFHVVRLTGIQEGKSRSLDEVRKELSAELARQKGERKYAESAEAFSNLVYEQAESLKPAAERFKLQIQTTGWVSKGGKQELGALDNPKLMAALFSPDTISNKRNTDAVEVAPSTLVAARVVEHQPAAQRKFDEVKDDITELLRRREAFKLAQQDGQSKLEQLRKGENVELAWSAPKMVSRRDAQGLPPELVRRAVAADASKLPAYDGMPIDEAGYLLMRITKVVEGKPAADDKQADARVANMVGAAEYEAYVASLKGRADISVNAANLEKK